MTDAGIGSVHRGSYSGCCNTPTPLQEEEEAYRARFPDYGQAFADLEDPEAPPRTDDEPAESAAALEQRAAYALIGRLKGTVLSQLTHAHQALFGPQAGGTLPGREPEQFGPVYELGQLLLEPVLDALPASADRRAYSGHIVALWLQHRTLSEPARKVLDPELFSMHASAAQEALLVRAPLEVLRKRLRELLQEWPEHVLLAQVTGQDRGRAWPGGRRGTGLIGAPCSGARGRDVESGTPLPSLCTAPGHLRPHPGDGRGGTPQGHHDRRRAAAGKGPAVGGHGGQAREPRGAIGHAAVAGGPVAQAGAGGLALSDEEDRAGRRTGCQEGATDAGTAASCPCHTGRVQHSCGRGRASRVFRAGSTVLLTQCDAPNAGMVFTLRARDRGDAGMATL